MVELTVGSRFWYKGKLCEVAEGYCDHTCVFFYDVKKCDKAKCLSQRRHDGKNVIFREVKE